MNKKSPRRSGRQFGGQDTLDETAESGRGGPLSLARNGVDHAEELAVEDNLLAEKAGEWLDAVRPHFRAILLALAGALLAMVTWIVVSGQREASRAASWDAYLSAVATGEGVRFNEVMNRYPGSQASDWAQLMTAEIGLAEGVELQFQSRELAQPKLQAAADVYADILTQRPQGMLGERATFGLAKANECLGQLEKARQGYESLTAEFPTSAMADIARNRASGLRAAGSQQWYDWFAAQKFTPPPAATGALLDATSPAAPAPPATQE
jgi:hypothetical protein